MCKFANVEHLENRVLLSVDFGFAHSIGSEGGASGYDEGTAIAVDADGNSVVAGMFRGRADFDPSSDEWILEANGSGITPFLAKYASDGSLVWAEIIGDVRVEIADIVVDRRDGIVVAGTFVGIVDIDPGEGVHRLTSRSDKVDLFVARFDPQGNLDWAVSMGGTSVEISRHVAVDLNDNIFVTGEFHGTVDFDPGSGVDQRTSHGDVDGFVVSLDAFGNYRWVA